MKMRLLISGLALMAATTFASAQTPDAVKARSNAKCSGKCKCGRFVDNNKDKVCDNFGNRKTNVSGQKGKGKNGTAMAKRSGKGESFVDANKNGVCDNREKK